jgi:hypothetical protein
MKRLNVSWITVLFVLALAPASLAQPGAAGEGSGAGLYDPKTVETVTGLVVSITPPPPPGSLPQRMQLTLKTDTETLPVFLGPHTYIDRQGMKIGDLDRISVRGSRLTVQGKPALIAQEVRKGNQVLKLRDDQGVPLWSPRKKEAPARQPSGVYPQGQGARWPK